MRVMRMMLGLLAALVGATAADAAPVKISIAWIAVPTNLAPILFAKPGIAKHLGQSYELDPVHYNGSSSMITAMASGDLDIGLLSYSTFAIAVQNAGMNDLRIVADDFQDGVKGYFTDHFLVLKDSPYKVIEDLRGKVVATSAIGGGNDLAMRVALGAHHLEANRDYSIVEIALPNMKAELAQRKVDLIPGTIPFSLDPELIKISRTLFIQRDYVGVTQVLLWAARTGFLQQNRAAMVDFMEDVIRARHFYLDPANHAEAVAIVTKFTKQPAALYDWAFTKTDTYRDPAALPNLDATQRNIETAYKLGFLKANLDVKQYSDLSIVKDAGARLK
jgi:NitT/TauT family transport system substrate-binding protein